MTFIESFASGNGKIKLSSATLLNMDLHVALENK